MVTATTAVGDASVTPAREVAARADAPRWLALLGALAAIMGVAMGLLGALAQNVTWDEPYHVMRLQAYFDDGRYSTPEELTGARDDELPEQSLVYAPVTALALHGLAVVTGAESPGEVATSGAAYTTRHLGVLGIGLLGALAVAGILRRLLGSWTWGSIGAGLLLSIPMWTGHSMFNLKDVPVGSGYTVLIWGLVVLAARCREPVPGDDRPAPPWLGGLAVTGGTLLMVGTRPGMWVAALGSTLLAGGVLTVVRAPRRLRFAAWTTAGLLVATGVLVAVYPALFSHPGLWWTAATGSAAFEHAESGRDYLPRHVGAEFPELILVLALVGVGSAVLALGRLRRDQVAGVGHGLVLSQALGLPLLGVYLGTSFYSGLRQVLFMVPAVAVLATIGLAACVAWAGAIRWRQVGVGSVVAIGVIVPVAEQASLFPYQYTYLNVMAAARGVPEENDYWRASFEEYVGTMPTDGTVSCSPWTRGPDAVARKNDCRTDAYGMIAPAWHARGLPVDDELPEGEFYGLFQTGAPLPANCSELDSVTRWQYWGRTVMSRLATCRADPDD